eukprot:symbB.v1.2.006047.t1/scaffold339.1/size225540/11
MFIRLCFPSVHVYAYLIVVTLFHSGTEQPSGVWHADKTVPQQSGSAKFLEDLPLRPEISASEAQVAPEHDFRAELRAAVRVCDLERLTHVLEELPVPTEILAESDGSGRTLLHLCTTWSNCWDAIEAAG